MFNGAETNVLPSDDSGYQHTPVRARQVVATLVDRRQNLRVMVIIFAFLFLGFLGIIRLASVSNRPMQGESAASEAGGLYTGLRIYDREPGKPIILQMSLYNMSGHRISLNFTKSPALDFLVQSPVHLFFTTVPLEVWRFSSRNKRFVFAENEGQTIEIMPGEERVFHGEWDRTDNDGKPVGSNRYIITGYINIDGGSRALNVERG